MRRILAICSLLAITLPCHAQGDKQKPNTLSAKEIAEGWLLLFDGETTFGWTTKGNVHVADSALVLPDAKSYIEQKVQWGSFEMHFQCIGVEDNKKGSSAFWLKNGLVTNGLSGGKPGWNDFKIMFTRNDQVPSYDLHGWLNGQKAITETNTKADLFGSPAFLGPSAGGKELQIRNIKLRAPQTKSLFNGKDLTGWTVFPKKKSQFTVQDGAITVKDGPGDLQTVGKYKDFILQLECKSNGKHLNSGIFFRCRDGEYQNGYEAQIRNEFTKEATQKYLIEEFDPKTNKLVGKKEQMLTAVDFGTGAIYRRQPARKQMSKDGEWFTMTIVAHGNHIATWVNGVQVTDWYDHRPKSDNARTGCKLDAGHISIQGHDPTTDLSFRNLRIAELK